MTVIFPRTEVRDERPGPGGPIRDGGGETDRTVEREDGGQSVSE